MHFQNRYTVKRLLVLPNNQLLLTQCAMWVLRILCQMKKHTLKLIRPKEPCIHKNSLYKLILHHFKGLPLTRSEIVGIFTPTIKKVCRLISITQEHPNIFNITVETPTLAVGFQTEAPFVYFFTIQ